MTGRYVRYLLMVLAIVIAQPSLARPHQALDSVEAMDTQIVATLAALEEGDIKLSRLLARQLAWRFPESQLGQLIHADLESAAALRDVSLAAHMPISQKMSELALEAQRRLKANTHSAQHKPAALIQAGKHMSQLVVVDLQTSVLHQYELNQHSSSLVRTHYIGSGEGGFGKQLEGDLKTPLGVYSITGYLAGHTLPDLYGSGALPIDYPNTLDRHLGRTGYGIWLHGVPSSQLSRTPFSSEGCVTMSNEHMSRLSDQLDVSASRIVLTNSSQKIPSARREQLNRELTQLFRRYKKAWLDGDVSTLLYLYQNHDYLGRRITNEREALLRVSSSSDLKDSNNPSTRRSSYESALEQLRAEDISILANPQSGDSNPANPSNIVMDAWFGLNNEYQITIYWSKRHDGRWQVVTESVVKGSL